VPSRLLLPLLVGLAATDCAPPPGDDSSGEPPRESTAAARRRVPLNADESDCRTDTTFQHTDPVGLVVEFVRRDADGAFERDDVARAWHDNALSCVERNLSDNYEIITAFYVEPLSRRRDTAAVLVTRTRAFELAWDARGRTPRLLPASGNWADTVVVVRTRYGWRIDRLHPGAHRFPSRALDELEDLTAADRTRLQRLGRGRGT
jgi:hypothetical protein